MVCKFSGVLTSCSWWKGPWLPSVGECRHKGNCHRQTSVKFKKNLQRNHGPSQSHRDLVSFTSLWTQSFCPIAKSSLIVCFEVGNQDRECKPWIAHATPRPGSKWMNQNPNWWLEFLCLKNPSTHFLLKNTSLRASTLEHHLIWNPLWSPTCKSNRTPFCWWGTSRREWGNQGRPWGGPGGGPEGGCECGGGSHKVRARRWTPLKLCFWRRESVRVMKWSLRWQGRAGDMWGPWQTIQHVCSAVRHLFSCNSLSLGVILWTCVCVGPRICVWECVCVCECFRAHVKVCVRASVCQKALTRLLANSWLMKAAAISLGRSVKTNDCRAEHLRQALNEDSDSAWLGLPPAERLQHPTAYRHV